jgi:septum formation protein
MIQIVLASQSPRRVDMLSWLDIPFRTTSSEFDESQIRHAKPRQLTRLLAEAKAESVMADNRGAIVIGSDAVVDLQGQTFEKPKTKEQQRQMLNAQFGQNARVYSSICIINTVTGEKVVKSRVTSYQVAKPTEEEIEAYIDSGQGMDKAGGYGNQDENGLFLGSLHGCYTNLLGFPLCDVATILRKMDVPIKVNVNKIVNQKTGRDC